MKTNFLTGSVLPKARALGVAIALACGASASMAGVASVNFSVSTTTDLLGGFVNFTSQYQSFNVNVLDGGGLHGAATDSYSQADWFPSSAYRQTTHGNALAVNGSADGAPWVRAETSGTARGTYATPEAANTASALGGLSGFVNLLDENGEVAAGNITFLIDYTLSVTEPGSNIPSDFALATLNFAAFNDTTGIGDSLAELLDSLNLAGGVGTKSGTFSVTLSLLAGEFAAVNFDANALASNGTIPEPSGWALAGGGLLALALVRRRRKDVTNV